MLLNSEALAVGGPSPGAVEWLHHQGLPTEALSTLEASGFRGLGV